VVWLDEEFVLPIIIVEIKHSSTLSVCRKFNRLLSKDTKKSWDLALVPLRLRCMHDLYFELKTRGSAKLFEAFISKSVLKFRVYCPQTKKGFILFVFNPFFSCLSPSQIQPTTNPTVHFSWMALCSILISFAWKFLVR
jgi:hypothetical protein